jgi:iron complex outermembrane receptor protein
MNSNPKLSYAIAAILSGSGMGMGISHAATATDTSATDSEGIAEIVVTAQRRSESLENVPITIQAITGDTLKQLNIATIDDLLRYTPNVTFSGNGPGTGNIFIRGLSGGGQGNQSESTTAPFPNVALYLDDQSMQFPSRNNNVYLVDMERVEILEGPQGTLFGGGAEAGAVRYITNKPKLDVTEGNVNAGYGITAGGDPNSSVNATLNLPLIADTLAVRAVIFNDHHGGYINNVPATIASSVQPSVTASNGALVGDATNPLTTQGIRLSALWKFNDDWNLLVQQNYQNMEADGYWTEYPYGVDSKQSGTAGCPAAANPFGCVGTALAPYSIEAFTPAFDKDRYESTAWTLNGKVSDFKLVYTGSYMTRRLEQQADYSNYLTSGSGSLYACTGSGAGYFKTPKPTKCYAPVGEWNDKNTNTHQSHEFRVSSNEDYRIRGLFGVFWEKFDLTDDMNYNYLPIPFCSPANLAIANAGGPDCISAVGPVPGFPATDPSLRDTSSTAFGQDAQRGYKQTAAFASLDFDIVPKVLTLTGGTRFYHYDEYETGSEYYTETHFLRSTVANPTPYPYGIVVDNPNGACTAAGGCGFGMNLHKTETGSRSRLNLTWHVMPDLMVYYTYSQGFRPGGFNRTGDTNGVPLGAAEIAFNANGTGDQYRKPVGWNSDNLINNELGLKSELFDHRLQVNLSTYLMHWNNIQLELFSPPDFGNTTFTVNGPSYTIKGVELQLVGRVTEGLTVQGSGSWNSSSQTNAPCLESVGTAPPNGVTGNPTPAGQCITQINGKPFQNAFGALGTAPAFSPAVEFNVRARYDWKVGDYKPFASVGAQHISIETNQPASFTPGYTQPIPTTTHLLYWIPGYTTYDGAIGVAKDTWTVQVIGSNLSNSDALTNSNSGQFIETNTPLRPRVLTLQFGYKF